MKKLLIICVLLLSGCSWFRKTDVNWVPDVKTEQVTCCITDQQVHGAIYSALTYRKLNHKWNIKAKTDNSFITDISCGKQKIEMVFENTDKKYTIAVNTGNIEDVYNYRYCIESHTNKINKYIKIYLQKAIRQAAGNELKGIK